MEFGKNQQGGVGMKKLKDQRGETLVESLASVLIAVMAFGILTTAAITAAKINARVREEDVSFRYDGAEALGAVTITLEDAGGRKTVSGKNGVPAVELYRENEYLYYPPARTGDTP